jgi:hypothetical protein
MYKSASRRTRSGESCGGGGGGGGGRGTPHLSANLVILNLTGKEPINDKVVG